MRSSVLPDPAGAWTMNESAGSRACSRCAASGITRSVIFHLVAEDACVDLRLLLRDAAEHLLVALAAGRFIVLGIHARLADGKGAPQRLELARPAFTQRLPRGVLLRLAALVLLDRLHVRKQ